VPANVESMRGKVDAAVDALAESNGLIGRLRDTDSSVWLGEAGDAFRENLDDKLVTTMRKAQTSLEKAVDVLGGWHTDLVVFKDQAARLDAEAAQARQQQARAQAAVERAWANPDFDLANQLFTDEASLRAAQSRLDRAESALREANTALQAADDTLESIMRRAHELEQEHAEVAGRAAGELADATDHLAPHRPGRFSGIGPAFSSALGSVGNFVSDHLDEIHSVLSTISAVSGFVALVTPPPVDAIALGVSVTAGAGALATDFANPEFRHALASGDVGAMVTLGADVLSVVPGASTLRQGIREGALGLEGVSDAARLTQLIREPGFATELVSHVPGVTRAAGAILPGENALRSLNVLWKGGSAAKSVLGTVRDVIS
jgi:hypothetical protein